MRRKQLISPTWWTSAAVARCIWSVAASGLQPSCWLPASGGSAEDWNVAAKPGPRVFPEVAKFTRVCAYDRPGTPVGEEPSRSDPVVQPTTAGNAVADLSALLTAVG